MLKKASDPKVVYCLCLLLLWGLLIKPAVAYAYMILDHGDRKVEFNLESAYFVPGSGTPLSLCVCHG